MGEIIQKNPEYVNSNEVFGGFYNVFTFLTATSYDEDLAKNTIEALIDCR